MNYEVIELNEKKVAGIKARTRNDDPTMSMVIGQLWQDFYGKGIYEQLPGKVNECCIGLYTNYEAGAMGNYDVVVCSEVQSLEGLPAEISTVKIPAGKYAKFIVKGNVQTACMDFWTQLWQMDLDRSFVADFEEYQGGEDMDNMEIHMYISIY